MSKLSELAYKFNGFRGRANQGRSYANSMPKTSKECEAILNKIQELYFMLRKQYEKDYECEKEKINQ